MKKITLSIVMLFLFGAFCQPLYASRGKIAKHIAAGAAKVGKYAVGTINNFLGKEPPKGAERPGYKFNKPSKNPPSPPQKTPNPNCKQCGGDGTYFLADRNGNFIRNENGLWVTIQCDCWKYFHLKR